MGVLQQNVIKMQLTHFLRLFQYFCFEASVPTVAKTVVAPPAVAPAKAARENPRVEVSPSPTAAGMIGGTARDGEKARAGTSGGMAVMTIMAMTCILTENPREKARVLVANPRAEVGVVDPVAALAVDIVSPS